MGFLMLSGGQRQEEKMSNLRSMARSKTYENSANNRIQVSLVTKDPVFGEREGTPKV